MLPAAMSASETMTVSAVTSAFADRIAAAGHAHDCGYGAAQFYRSLRVSFVEPTGADLAGVEEGGDFSIGFLVEQKRTSTPLSGFVAVKFSS